ncbi:hypothetical protein [Ktedonospora formicarum]|uniref:Uncharacterized protein n=1 Tax=Ktedonospora formicarum TaxID=2778364 RepID=A0A8J3I6Z2_9CHLR|nr:hypothetical protein [Ktedonospora formicarum]GHO48556.1 hypothetical protein KSX_67190 [Ktedonospora formicarum]
MKREVDLATASGDCCLDPPIFEELVTRYGHLLHQGYEANPPESAPTKKKQGKAKQSTGSGLALFVQLRRAI